MSSAPPKVLWIIDYFPRPHDTTTGIWALQAVRALKAQGVEVAVFSPTPWIPRWLAWTKTLRDWSTVPEEWSIDGITVYFPRCLHYPHRAVTRWLYHPMPWLDSWLVWWTCRRALARVLKRFPAQVVHSNFIYPNGFLGWQIKRRYGLPLVVQEHSPQRLAAAQAHPRRREIYQRVICAADVVIGSNRAMAAALQALAPQRPAVRILVAGASPIPAELQNQAKPDVYRDRPVVLSVGALNDRKGHAYLIRAIAELRRELPAVKCLIIGQGARRAALSALIEELGVQDHVELLGPRPHAEVLRTMSWCDVFALPSWAEAFGAVYSEAMFCGKPVIASEGDGGINEVARDGVHVLMVKPQDVATLANALRRLLTDPALAARLGAEGHRLAVQELSCDGVATKLIGIYDGLLNQEAPAPESL